MAHGQQKIILAYSGGLDTSVCLKWLQLRGYEVIALLADVGQGENLALARRRALATGASRVHVLNVQREFVEEYVFHALKAQAVYEGKYLLATALSRPLIAAKLVDVAHRERATTVAHGCTGKGNDQVRFEVTIAALDPTLKIIAPVREWELTSRAEEIAFAQQHRIPIEVTQRSPYSMDRNLWGTSIECGVLEDPWHEPPSETYRSIRPPERAPRRPTYLEIGFTRGVPTHLNGRRVAGVPLIQRLSVLGARYGVGRSDLIEDRLVGIKSREVYEAPAAAILYEAHAELERLVLDRELLHLKEQLALKYAQLIYFGLWFTRARVALDAFVEATQQHVSGTVRVKLMAGRCMSVGRRSPQALYHRELATYGAGDVFRQAWAEGFIRLWGLPYEGQGTRGQRSGKR